MQSFYSRSLTAVAFVFIMMVGLLWNHLSFYILLLLIGVLGFLEFIRLIEKIHPGFKSVSAIVRVLLVLCIPAGFLIASGRLFSFRAFPASFWGLQLLSLLIILSFISSPLRKFPKRSISNLLYGLLGVLYMGLPLSLFIDLKWEYPPADLPIVPLAIVVFIWINDTMAYIIGSLIGKHPFAPKISPKKTWEGTIGGILLTLLIALVWSRFNSYFPAYVWMLLAFTTAVFGTLGDLLESFLKRKADVKDSGTLLPSHGGILDRFDSLFLAIPFVWILLFFLRH